MLILFYGLQTVTPQHTLLSYTEIYMHIHTTNIHMCTVLVHRERKEHNIKSSQLNDKAQLKSKIWFSEKLIDKECPISHHQIN